MSPDPRDPTDPREWLRRSRSNLARARAGRPEPIKAVLVSKDVAFPRTHTLVELMALVEDVGIVVPTDVREAGRLRTS